MLGYEPFDVTDADGWDYQKAAHLLRRCMIGPTHAEILVAVSEGLDATLNRLFTPFEPSYERVLEFAGQDPNNKIPDAGEGSPEGEEFRRLKLLRRDLLGKWWMELMVRPEISLQERLTFFWHNHFTSDAGTVEYAERMFVQNELFRRSAFGNVRRLARDVTWDVAMLVYLDGATNVRTASENFINENYSRELLELYTMGVVDRQGRPNYTQRDVAEGARALTGLRVDGSPKEGYGGITSHFDRDRWDPGEKEYLGRRGALGADDVIDIIFSERSDAVARFICGKFYRYFVSLNPDSGIIDQMAADLVAADWDLSPMLRHLFASAHFYSDANRGALVKSSYDIHLFLVRSLAARNIPDFDDTLELTEPNDGMRARLMAIGHMPLHPPNVKGWPGGKSWVNSSTIASRLEFATKVVAGSYSAKDGTPLYTYDPIALARGFSDPENSRKLTSEIAAWMLGRDATATEFALLYATLLDGGVNYEWSLDDPAQKAGSRIRKLLGGVVQLPGFQLY